MAKPIVIKILGETSGFNKALKDVDSSLSGIGKRLRSEVGQADGAFNKMRAGGAVAFDGLKANAVEFAVAAGAALVAFGVQSVKAFQDTALAAGTFADATGVSVEAASRLIEVSGDLGIESGTVETALGKMNKTLGGSPELFDKLGVEIAKTSDGATDVNGTFLNVVDRLNAIKDPAERARVASQLLGKGWQGMAELINQGSDGLAASLAGVADAQVIDQKELKKARDFRDRMDEVKDKLGAVALTLGEELVPSLVQAADAAIPVIQAAATLAEYWTKFGNEVKNTKDVSADMYLQMGLTTEQLEEMGYSVEEVIAAHQLLGESIASGTDASAEMARIYGERVPQAMDDTAQAFDAAAEEANDLAIKTGRVTRAAEALKAEWQRLKGEIDDKQAWLNMQGTFDEVRDKGAAAMKAVADGTEDADEKMRDYQLGVLDVKSDVVDLGEEYGLLPSEVETLLKMVDNGQIDDVERRLEILTRNRTVNLDIIQRGGAGYGDRVNGRFAAGGPVAAGKPYLVGERGPEVIVPSSSGTVVPNHAIKGTTTGGVVVNVTSQADPYEIGRAVAWSIRTSGR